MSYYLLPFGNCNIISVYIVPWMIPETITLTFGAEGTGIFYIFLFWSVFFLNTVFLFFEWCTGVCVSVYGNFIGMLNVSVQWLILQNFAEWSFTILHHLQIKVNSSHFSFWTQACRRQALSTPRKPLQSLTYCSDSERDGHRLPPRSVSRLMQRPDHLLFQKNFQCEERKGYCNSTQQRNQLRTQTRDLLTEDLKFPTSSRLSDSARAPPCEERQCDVATEHQKVTGMEKRETKCRRSNRLTLFICAMVFAVLLLALWKQQDPSNELYFVPT